MARTTPYVVGGTLVIGSGDGARTIAVGSDAWFAWLNTATSFAFESATGTFVARRERASSGRGGWYWRAYQRRAGGLKRAYLGKAQELTLERLDGVAGSLASAAARNEPSRPTTDTATPPGVAQAPSALPLLATKLYIPQAQPTLVARPRLLDRLWAGLGGKLTLIAAPAGFGKTTLLAEWLASLRLEASNWRLGEARLASGLQSPAARVAWLSLDPADNDPTTFMRYLVAALQTIAPEIGTAVLLGSPRIPPPDVLMVALLNDLAKLPGEALLVLDDYHTIATPAIHQALGFLLDHLPPQLHIAIATREDPPLQLARLRARGQLTELRAADLRFTTDETAAFYRLVMRVPLTAEQVSALESRTEGWIAGLQFAALAVRDQSDIAGFIDAFTGSHRFVVDYLAEEVINQLPHHFQTFLLQTAVLDRMCASLCDAVLLGEHPGAHQPYSQALLEELERSNLFIVPLDSKRQWYRYHHLFVDVLRGRLASGATPDMLATLHRRASAWFERQDLVAEAIQHALAANDCEQAARLVELHGDTIWMHGGVATLVRWLAALPDTILATHPKLALNHAFLLVALDAFALSEQRLATAEGTISAASDPDTALLGQAAVIHAAIALLTEQPAEVTIAASQEALKHLPENSLTWRSHAHTMLGLGYYVQAGDLELGLQHLAEAERASLRAGDAFIAASAAVHLSLALEVGGQLRASERLNMHNLQRGAEPFWQGVPLVAYARLGLGRICYERNDLEAAHEHFAHAIAQLETWALKRPLIIGCVWLARVHGALGEPEQAREWMQRARAIVHKDNLKQTFSHWAAYRAQLALAHGEPDIAAQWAREIEASLKGMLNPAHEFEHITLARVYLAQQRISEAHALLARLLTAAEMGGRLGRALEIRLLQAIAAHILGQRAEALATVVPALALAEREGYIRMFVDVGSPMQALLAEAQQAGIARDYVAKLLAAFPSSQFNVLSSEFQEVATQNSLVEPLTPRELEVLRLLTLGASNGAIAEALVISVGTAKKHVNNILAKLDVRSRTQAAIWARSRFLRGTFSALRFQEYTPSYPLW